MADIGDGFKTAIKKNAITSSPTQHSVQLSGAQYQVDHALIRKHLSKDKLEEVIQRGSP